MPRIFLLGFGPLPREESTLHTAAGARTWQFARSLAELGVDVDLGVIEEGVPDSHGEPSKNLSPDGMRVSRLSRQEAESGQLLRERLRRLAPDALVGATTFASYLLARTGHEAPLWVDFNGDPMAEGQVLAAARGQEQPVLEAWWMLAWCLRRGDRFSAVSPSQRLALLGQLGAYGRLGASNAQEALVACVPEAVEDLGRVPASPAGRDPIVLFSGSFNSWTDGPTLVEGLRIALSRSSRLRFVATGGAVPGLAEEPWLRFRAALDSFDSDSRRRVELPGWVSSEELLRIEATAACGVVPELAVLERELGGQNRSLRWMARGIPVVTTPLSDLGRTLCEQNLAVPYRAEDPDSLAEAILRVALDAGYARELADRGREWVLTERSIAATTRDLRAWALEPKRAADRIDGSAGRLASRHAEMLRDQLHLEAEPSKECD